MSGVTTGIGVKYINRKSPPTPTPQCTYCQVKSAPGTVPSLRMYLTMYCVVPRAEWPGKARGWDLGAVGGGSRTKAEPHLWRSGAHLSTLNGRAQRSNWVCPGHKHTHIGLVSHHASLRLCFFQRRLCTRDLLRVHGSVLSKLPEWKAFAVLQNRTWFKFLTNYAH